MENKITQKVLIIRGTEAIPAADEGRKSFVCCLNQQKYAEFQANLPVFSAN